MKDDVKEMGEVAPRASSRLSVVSSSQPDLQKTMSKNMVFDRRSSLDSFNPYISMERVSSESPSFEREFTDN
jgi:hypothetical protein